MEERTPEEREELEEVANAADPAQGFEIHEPTEDELDDDDGYVAADDAHPEPHDARGSVDEPALAEEEGLDEDEEDGEGEPEVSEGEL
jgi:hypothetical protein